MCCDDGCSESASVQESEEEEVITQFLQHETLVDSGAYITVMPTEDSETGEQSMASCSNNLSARPMVDSMWIVVRSAVKMLSSW